MRFKRELVEGDRVRCQGKTFMVKEILSQDFYNCDWDDSRSYIDIEFTDVNGGYHHWKSSLDGGEVLCKDDSNKGSVLREYYDPMSGRYYIPFSDVDERVSDAIIALISDGYGLSAYDGGEGNTYTVFKVFNECKFLRNLSSMGGKVYDWLHECGCHYFDKMTLDEYFSKPLYQSAVDSILMREEVENTKVFLVCRGGSLQFVEADDLFA